MTSNDERREVAARLRMLASHKAADEELVHDTLGLYRGENIEGYDTYGVMHLADLIDPEPKRTCHFRNDGHGILWCDAEGCDYEMDDYLPIPKHCPNCGAKVVE